DARARGGRPRWRRPRRRLGRLREVTGAGRRLTRPGDRRALPPAAGSAGGRKPPGRRAPPRPTRRPGGEARRAWRAGGLAPPEAAGGPARLGEHLVHRAVTGEPATAKPTEDGGAPRPEGPAHRALEARVA